TGRQRLDGADWVAINRLFAEMEAEGRALLARAGVAANKVAVSRIAEMRYLGQGHEVEAAVPLGKLSAASLAKITRSFGRAYRALSHRLAQGGPIEALNWRLTVSGPDPKTRLGGHAKPDGVGRAAPKAKPVKGTRRAYFAERGGFVETPVYDRYALTPGMTLKGPAIVEERESTAVIGPGGRARVDTSLALIVETSR